MAPKRKNEGEEPTARERKKQKIAVARTIAVQSTTTPTSTSENAVAGPSNLRAVTFDSECPSADSHVSDNITLNYTRYERTP